MKQVKFTFDTHFDDGPRESASAARTEKRSRKSYSSEEIDALCNKARDDGRNAGEIRAKQALAAAISQVAASVEILEGEIEAIRGEAAQLALAAARRLAAAALSFAPKSEIEEALRTALHQAVGEPRVVIRVAPALADEFHASAAEFAAHEGFEGRIQIVSDGSLAGADCRIEWRGGGIERNAQTIDNSLAELIARRFAPGNLPQLSQEKE